MNFKWKVALLSLAFVSAPCFAEAPFCAVTSVGQQHCFYYTVDACRQAAASLNGMCVANQQQVQQLDSQIQQQRPAYQPQIQSPNIVGSFLQGQAQGQRMRQQREDHEMRMRLAEAEIAAIEAQRQQQSSVGENLYECPGNESSGGWPIMTTTPLPGCKYFGPVSRSP